MNVVSIELAKKLAEVSGWESDHAIVIVNPGLEGEYVRVRELDADEDIDEVGAEAWAYDLGHVLSNLPQFISWQGDDLSFFISPVGRKVYTEGEVADWATGYMNHSEMPAIMRTDERIEDAAALIAIELFEQGVLTRGGDE